MTANPNQHWGEENHTSVSRFVTGIVSPREPDNSGETPAGVHDLCKSLEGWFEWSADAFDLHQKVEVSIT